jgi:hypothetical protein
MRPGEDFKRSQAMLPEKMEGMPGFELEIAAEHEVKDDKNERAHAEPASYPASETAVQTLTFPPAREGAHPAQIAPVTFNHTVMDSTNSDPIVQHPSQQQFLMHLQAQQHQAYLMLPHTQAVSTGGVAPRSVTASPPLSGEVALDPLTCPPFYSSAQYYPGLFSGPATHGQPDAFTLAPGADLQFYHHASPFSAAKRQELMEFSLGQNVPFQAFPHPSMVTALWPCAARA